MKTRTLLCIPTILLLCIARSPGQLPADPDVTTKLVGSWDYQESGLKGLDQFKNDGTFKGSASGSMQDKAFSISVEGKWSIKDGMLTEVITKSDHPELVPVGATTHDKLIEVTDKTFKARTEDGTEQIHTRHPVD